MIKVAKELSLHSHVVEEGMQQFKFLTEVFDCYSFTCSPTHLLTFCIVFVHSFICLFVLSFVCLFSHSSLQLLCPRIR